MINTNIKQLYYSLGEQEKCSLQFLRQAFEQRNNIRFISLEAYVIHLALEIIDRERNGEFLPRSEEEAIAGYHF